MQSATSHDRLLCAHCQGHGKLACKGCLLVLYCGADCQKAHWSAHKSHCKSPLIKDSWKPQWEVEVRQPAFIGEENGAAGFGGKKFFWGNVPAIDVLRLSQNEGDAYDKDVGLLFAASGDVRNVIKTIASIPTEYGGSLNVHINDRDFDIVARNVIILLVLLTVEDSTQAVECAIHIWYSAQIRPTDVDLLNGSVRPLVQDVCQKVAGKTSGTVLGKTWTFGKKALRLVLQKEQWASLLEYSDIPVGLTSERAQQIRTAVTLADKRRDYRERRLSAQVPAHRGCIIKFREDGILLPFGYHRESFSSPNPKFFQTTDWPMKDSAEPLDGWDVKDVLKADTGPASNDIYGKLYYYVADLLSTFRRRLTSLNVGFEISNHAAEDLRDHLKGRTFARVEVSSISDSGYLGCPRTVAYLGPLLQSPTVNRHATLLTMFMNAVEKMAKPEDDMSEEVGKLVK